MRKNAMYLVVTNDRYELPVYEGETMTEIGKHFGLGTSNISRACSDDRPICRGRYKIVVIGPEDEDEEE